MNDNVVKLFPDKDDLDLVTVNTSDEDYGPAVGTLCWTCGCDSGSIFFYIDHQAIKCAACHEEQTF